MVLIYLMIALQENRAVVEQSKEGIETKRLPFDTQMSQQAHQPGEDKGFTPWVRQKTIIHHQYSPQELDYHRFLATIRLSPRQKGRFRKDHNNMEQVDNLEIIKADLTSKIRAEKIGNADYTQQKLNNRSTQAKNFFQRRANLTKLYRRPKSIDLSLQFDPKNILKCSPLNNTSHLVRHQDLHTNKKQLRTIHKLRKKKQSLEQQSRLSSTMKNFRVNIMSVQKKVYQTLQLNLTEASQKLKRPETDHGTTQIRTLTSFHRPKFSKHKAQKHIVQQGETLACLGKNALISFGHKTCRQRIKEHQFFNKAQENQIFT